MASHENPAFVNDDGRQPYFSYTITNNRMSPTSKSPSPPPPPPSLPLHQNNAPPIELSITNGTPPAIKDSITNQPETSSSSAKSSASGERDLWGKEIEFLLSCIAMSVGLGNVWRFPFTALENGGGAFLIPYLIVLFLVGKPIYYLEMLIGQFSSRGAVKVYDLCPAMRGIGVGQVISISIVTTYYVALMGITVRYLIASFHTILPWSVCQDEWNAECIPSTIVNTSITLLNTSNINDNDTISNSVSNISSSSINNIYSKPISSAELFFLKEILREKDSIDDGIGVPNWQLVLGLLASWIIIYVIIIKGVRSSGKASYFLAIFPYIVLGILLIRAITLPGSLNGIIYFIKPQWGEILNPQVWYAAVTQVFFSLSVCFGNIIMYASYNKFGHNVHKDATIVTLLDTFTSLLAGFTIFGILGHLAHEIGTEDVGSVVKGGTGLAFISYPEAIAKFKNVPQIFSVLFFLMLFVLGVGSNIAMTSCTMTAIRDNFPQVKHWHAAFGIAAISFCIGLVYITPGGQFILNLVDYFGASMIAIVLAIAELFTLSWCYGVRRICRDAEFMIGKNPNLYWRLCWGVITPALMTAILIYTFFAYEPLTYKGHLYPEWAYAIGWTISAIGILQLPIWACIAIIRQPGDTILEKIAGAFRPTRKWGPIDPALREKYQKFLAADEDDRMFEKQGIFMAVKKNLFG